MGNWKAERGHNETMRHVTEVLEIILELILLPVANNLLSIIDYMQGSAFSKLKYSTIVISLREKLAKTDLGTDAVCTYSQTIIHCSKNRYSGLLSYLFVQ